MNLEELETHSVIFDSLEIAEKAQRMMQKDIDNFNELFERIDEQKSASEQIQTLFKDKAILDQSEEQELLEELESLEAGQVESQLNNSILKQKLVQQRKNEEDQIGMLEKELENLSLDAGETTSQSTRQSEERKESRKAPQYV